MLLRNKKTGKIKEIQTVDLVVTGQFCDNIIDRQPSLAKLNEEWEDYEPEEPLIKDEKMRKAVKAWARVNELTVVRVFYIDETETLKLDSGVNLISISFDSEEDYSQLNRETHTITELCGEED